MPINRILPTAVALLAFAGFATTASAQIRHKVEVKKVEIQMQQTPSYAAAGPKDKRWDPLEWLEIEVELDVDTIEPTKIIPEITATFYLALPNKSNPTGGNVMLTDRVTFVNIRTHSGKAHLVAYVNPDTLTRFTGQEKASESDIISAGVEIDAQGVSNENPEKLAGATKKNGWWKQVTYPREQGMILAKGKTPFALLWYDFYPQTRDDR